MNAFANNSVLILSVVAAGTLHIFIPIHWVAFVSEGKRRNMSSSRVLFYSTFSACVHVSSTSFLAVLGFVAGRGTVDIAGRYANIVTALLLCLLAVWIMWSRNRPAHEHKVASRTMWGITFAAGLHPSIEVAVLFMSFPSVDAAVAGWFFYAVSVLLVQAVLVTASLRLAELSLTWMVKRGKLITSVVLLAVAVYVVTGGHSG